MYNEGKFHLNMTKLSEVKLPPFLNSRILSNLATLYAQRRVEERCLCDVAYLMFKVIVIVIEAFNVR